MTVTAESLRWQDFGTCPENPGLFFGPDAETLPEREQRERDAKRLCARCPVITDCLGHALDNRIRFGIWGGMTETERDAHHRHVLAARRRLARKPDGVLMIPRVLVCVALAVAWLSGKHVTVWIVGCPAASISALTVVALIAAVVFAALVALIWCMRAAFREPLVRRTTLAEAT